MRINFRKNTSNEVKIKLKNNVSKNLSISIIITVGFVFVCLLTYLISIIFCPQIDTIIKATQHYSRNQYFTAAKYYKKAFRNGDHIKNVDYYNYGATLVKLGAYDLAIQVFEQLKKIEPSNSNAAYNLSYVLYLKAKQNSDKTGYLTAAAYLDSALTEEPSSEQLYILSGLCYRNAEAYDKAIDVYVKALNQRAFNKSTFYTLIGHTFVEGEDYKQAINYYRMAVAESPTSLSAYLYLGDAYYYLNSMDQSLDSYKKALQINRDSVEPYIRIGSLYSEQNQNYEAIQWFLQAFRINPDNDDVAYNLAMAYESTGRTKETVEYLKKAALLGSSKAIYKLKEMNIKL
jgi:tetratricopeptide (TPR) repeat protein